MKLRFVTRGPHCQGLTRYAYSQLPKPEREHFVLCRKCGHYFDMRHLDQAVAHSFLDHNACSPIARTYSGIRGEPVTIKRFKVIPRGQTTAIAIPARAEVLPHGHTPYPGKKSELLKAEVLKR